MPRLGPTHHRPPSGSRESIITREITENNVSEFHKDEPDISRSAIADSMPLQEALIPALYKNNHFNPHLGRNPDRKLLKVTMYDVLLNDKILKSFKSLEAATRYLSKLNGEGRIGIRNAQKPSQKFMRSFTIPFKTRYDLFDKEGNFVKTFKSKVQAHNTAFKLGFTYKERKWR